MKKYLKIFILIMFCACFFCGCSCGKDPSISYAHSSISVNIGYNFIIQNSDVKIENSKSNFAVEILDTEIAEIDGLTIKPKQAGETTLRFKLVDNESIKCDVKLTVTDYVMATSASIEKDRVDININGNPVAYNRITLSDGCTEIPDVRYDKTIINFDYQTGRIEALSIGQTQVVVLYQFCNVSFNVYVTDKVYVKELIVKDNTIFVGSSGKFKFDMFPENGTEYSFFCNQNDKIKVNPDGTYEALQTGELDVYFQYTATPNSAPILKTFKVYVIEPVDEFEISILSNAGSEVKYYLLEKSYILDIYLESSFASEDIVLPDFIDTKTALRQTEYGYTVEFTFSNKGDVEFSVGLKIGNALVESSKNVTVYDVSDINVRGKYFTSLLDTGSDGKYHISLADIDGNPMYIQFVAMIKDMFVDEDLKVYIVGQQKRELASNNIFDPESDGDGVGEYSFEFELFGHNLGGCTVVVESN